MINATLITHLILLERTQNRVLVSLMYTAAGRRFPNMGNPAKLQLLKETTVLSQLLSGMFG